jgi:hypothetical protein
LATPPAFKYSEKNRLLTYQNLYAVKIQPSNSYIYPIEFSAYASGIPIAEKIDMFFALTTLKTKNLLSQ